ncbi:hypothetical protein RHSIM_Rhsim05G0093400 [Rhododendron simsii]|uniref:MADS-box domain-containing protein n=1 Tax=Rhododendron simsii TaxID=118357 RepID=A0A834GWR2_RHOSS|nr:hypothetical protein RHSIM_Rhsim05G0093400 [Rhododendron simsii]
MARKNKGRQRIEMTRMSKESNLLVTFSKRRSGLFKKASELCTLCGAEIAIVVFSPGKKAFSFGHPSVGAIVDRFLSRTPPPPRGGSRASNRRDQPLPLPPPPPNPNSAVQLLEAHRNAAVRELSNQLTEAMNQLEAEKKRGEGINKMRRESKERCWWDGPIDGLGLGQLEQLKVAMEDLKRNVGKQAERVRVVEEEGLKVPTASFYAGGTSSFVGSGSGAGGVGVDGGGDVKVSDGLGLSMTPHGYALGYGCGFF